MSSRYPQPDQGDARYSTRDRSPPRFSDRRSSTTYNAGPQPPRESNFRSFEANAQQPPPRDQRDQSGPDLPREPPRGPKAYVDAPRGGYAPRGRGFAARTDYRDRDFRDPRDGPSVRGGRDREWFHHRGSSDIRDRRISPPGRGRTRSPPQRDHAREVIPRDSDRDRFRRDSVPDPPHPASFRGRGAFRTRGRGDWDAGPRARRNFVDERDVYRVRSRSRERPWERSSRDDRDQDLFRRDDDRRRSWDDKDRDFDRFRRDPPLRPDSRNSSTTNPSTPHSANAPFSGPFGPDRGSHALKGPGSDTSRRSSGPNTTSNYPGPTRDSGRNEGPPMRQDRERFNQQPPSSPPQAPQVPAFGSISYRPPAVEQIPAAKKPAIDTNISPALPQHPQDLSRAPPPAPKAHLANSIPTAPKAEQNVERFAPSEPKPLSTRIPNVERHPGDASLVPPLAPSGPRGPATDLQGEGKGKVQQPSMQPRQVSENINPRISQTVGSPAAIRTTSLQLIHPSRREKIEEHARKDVSPAYPSRQTHREMSLPGQASPAKVPIGPKADRSAPSIRQGVPPAPRAPPIRHPNPQWRGGPQANLTWVRPGLAQGLPQTTPRGPSIMNTVPTKRDSAGDERARLFPDESDDREDDDLPWGRGGPSLKAALDEAKAEGERPESRGKMLCPGTAEKRSSVDSSVPSPLDIEARSPRHDESPKAGARAGAEEGLMDLDENDYEVAERKYRREQQVLEAQRPPSPLKNPELLTLLEEVDTLAIAAEDLAKGVVPQLLIEPRPPPPIPISGLPSPKAEELEGIEAEVEDKYDFVVIHRHPTPPVDKLPFLADGPPTPFSEIDDFESDDGVQELVKSRIIDHIRAEEQRSASQHAQMKMGYAICFRAWREKNWELEEAEKARHEADPPVAPVEPAPIVRGPMTSISGVRGRARNAGELEIEAIMELSRQTAAAEEEKRSHLFADRGPNYDKEAIVPDMLTQQDALVYQFDDRTNLVPSNRALQALAFAPPKDDFSAEEHDKFVNQYLLTPKKWGMIADVLPIRDYQDCVQHYYLTKRQCSYKEKERAFLRIRKGRRGPRGPQGRAKSSNLIPLYDGNNENEQGAAAAAAAAAAVTETGRPKRNAAPVFGPTSDVEGPAPAVTPMRRNAGAKDGNPEASAEKPKRRGGGVPREKGGRKTKAPLLAAAPVPSPQKGEKESIQGKSQEPKSEMEQGLDDLKGAQLLAEFHNSQMGGMTVNQAPVMETWMNRPPAPIDISYGTVPKAQQPSMVEVPPPQQQRAGPNAPSSYWSVPDIADFARYLGYYGTNWQAIADAMKSKTITMVNYLLGWPSFSLLY